MPPPRTSLPARFRRSLGPIALAAAILVAGAAPGAPLVDGDILVADASANKLFVINPVSGLATELASAGFILTPIGVGVRSDGFAFVTNAFSQLLVRIDPTAVSPTPVQVITGVIVNPRGIVLEPGGDAFLSSPSSDEIIRVDTVTGSPSIASGGGLIHFPFGLVREASGDLVVADSSTLFGRSLYRVNPQNGDQTLLASGTLGNVWRDVEIDPTAAGRFLVIDSGVRKVIQIDATVPFNPLAPQANQADWAACPGFISPRGIAVEPTGFVLVSDFTARKVFRIHPVTKVCSELATSSALLGPWDITVVGGLVPFVPGPLLVADAGTADLVQRVDPASGTSAPIPANVGFLDPVAAIRALNGDIFVLEFDRIYRVTLAGVQTLVTTFAPPVDLTGIVVDADGEILVTDAANDRVVRVIPGTGDQIVVADDDSTPRKPIGDPAGLTMDRNGTLLVANRGDPSEDPVVQTGLARVNPISGTTSVELGSLSFGSIVGVALDSNGDYLMADEGTDTVWRFRRSTPANLVLLPVSIGNRIQSLRGIVVDTNRSILVSNQGDPGYRILRIDPSSGVQTAVAPLVAFSDIQGIAFDQIPTPPLLDSDNDGFLEDVDNCPENANADQLDTDGDLLGDACDADDDGDGVLDVNDNCSLVVNPDQADSNLDGFGNLCDADFDNDAGVGILDFGLFRGQFGKSVPIPDPTRIADYDLDSDGAVGLLDFALFRGLFGRPPGPSGLACAGIAPCPLPPPPPPP